MNQPPPPAAVIVPGLRGEVPEHWQSILADELGAAGWAVSTMAPPDGDPLDCAARVANLEKAVSQAPSPPVLIAHSAGVITTVHWARSTSLQVKGALLATPPDLDEPLPAGYPTPEALREGGWTPTPRAELPFPSIVAASTDDPLAATRLVTDLADAWGSKLLRLGAGGPLTPASGYGRWAEAERLVRTLAGG
jgi:predicted alpha/beta hydrolase family esterase